MKERVRKELESMSEMGMMRKRVFQKAIAWLDTQDDMELECMGMSVGETADYALEMSSF